MVSVILQSAPSMWLLAIRISTSVTPPHVVASPYLGLCVCSRGLLSASASLHHAMPASWFNTGSYRLMLLIICTKSLESGSDLFLMKITVTCQRKLTIVCRALCLSRSSRYRDFCHFPRQIATFTVFRDKSRFLPFSATNRTFCCFPRHFATFQVSESQIFWSLSPEN